MDVDFIGTKVSRWRQKQFTIVWILVSFLILMLKKPSPQGKGFYFISFSFCAFVIFLISHSRIKASDLVAHSS